MNHDNTDVPVQASVQPYDPTTFFSHKFGSSFNQLQAPLTKTVSSSRVDRSRILIFKEAMIRKVFQMIQKFLNKDLLEFLDNLADDIFVSSTIKIFPYKSFSETLHLVLISLLRELLHAQTSLSPAFLLDVQEYIRQVGSI